MYYLLDTNICIYLIKQKPPKVLARFQTLVEVTWNVRDLSLTTTEIALHMEKIIEFCALLRRYHKGRWQIIEFALFGSVLCNDDDILANH